MKLEPISKSEAARYMGVKGQPDGQVMELLDSAEPIIRENISPKYVYRETALRIDDSGVHAEGMGAVLAGQDIRKHLSGCNRIIVMAATLTSESDKLIRQAAVTGMADSLAMDCLCSAAIEQVCDRAEEEIFSVINAPYRTWRFSPGYGDFDIHHQDDILRMLDTAKKTGLTMTDSYMLTPTKSVTAIIGISDTQEKCHIKGCEVCEKKDCIYRRN